MPKVRKVNEAKRKEKKKKGREVVKCHLRRFRSLVRNFIINDPNCRQTLLNSRNYRIDWFAKEKRRKGNLITNKIKIMMVTREGERGWQGELPISFSIRFKSLLTRSLFHFLFQTIHLNNRYQPPWNLNLSEPQRKREWERGKEGGREKEREEEYKEKIYCSNFFQTNCVITCRKKLVQKHPSEMI